MNFNSTASCVRAFFARFAKPITAELPFFVIFFVLNYGTDFPSAKDVAFNLGFTFLLSYVATALFVYNKPLIFKIILYIISLLVYPIELFCRFCLCQSISPKVLILIAETNPDEAGDFFSSYADKSGFIATLVIVALMIFCILFFEKKHRSSNNKLSMNTVASAIIFSFTLFGVVPAAKLTELFFAENTDEITNWYQQNNMSIPLTNISQSAWTLHISSKETQQMVAAHRQLPKSTISTQDTLDVVLVIGESFIKKHSSLYGYSLKTNPLLEQELDKGHLVCFDSISSVSNRTSSAVRNLLCTNSIADSEHWHQSYYMPTIFKQSGYDVFFWSNQMKKIGSI